MSAEETAVAFLRELISHLWQDAAINSSRWSEHPVGRVPMPHAPNKDNLWTRMLQAAQVESPEEAERLAYTQIISRISASQTPAANAQPATLRLVLDYKRAIAKAMRLTDAETKKIAATGRTVRAITANEAGRERIDAEARGFKWEVEP